MPNEFHFVSYSVSFRFDYIPLTGSPTEWLVSIVAEWILFQAGKESIKLQTNTTSFFHVLTAIFYLSHHIISFIVLSPRAAESLQLHMK